MTIALYAGSFDPITYGHLDILERGTKIFDKVIIAVAYNESKQGFLPVSERLELIKECTKNFSNIEIYSYTCLTVNFAKEKGATVLLRGLRNTTDFEYENMLAQNNKILHPNIETVFLTAKPEYCFITSSGVREILKNDGNISNLVPDCVSKYLKG